MNRSFPSSLNSLSIMEYVDDDDVDYLNKNKIINNNNVSKSTSLRTIPTDNSNYRSSSMRMNDKNGPLSISTQDVYDKTIKQPFDQLQQQQPQPRPKSKSSTFGNSFIMDIMDDNDNNHRKTLNVFDDDFNRRYSTMDSFATESKKQLKQQTKQQNKNFRKSSSIILITLFDTLMIILLLSLAIILRFTDEIKPIETWYSKRLVCQFPKLYDLPFKILPNSHGKLLFENLYDDLFLFYIFVFMVPIAMIIFMEISRLIIRQISHDGPYPDDREDEEDKQTIVIPKTNLLIPLSLRRTVRIIAGFILGFAASSIICDFIKLQTGQYRPYVRSICPDFCNETTNCWDALANDLRLDVRKSFPSITTTFCSYTTLFMVYYLTAALNYRAIKVFRLLLCVFIIIIGILMSLSRLTTYRNHWWDIVAGCFIGSLSAYYIVWYHLNGFTNRLSISNIFSAKYKDYRAENSNKINQTHDSLTPANYFQFHIPRVQTSAKNGDIIRNASNLTKSKSMNSNAYINPAFTSDEQIINHHSISSDRIILDSNNNQLIKNRDHNRSKMHTFAK